MILVCLETRQQCAAHSLILAWLSCIACCYEQQFGPYHLSNGSDRLHWHFEPYCPLEKKRMIINWCHKCHISFALLYAYSNILLSLVAFILAHVVFPPCCDLCTRGLQGYQTDKGNKVLKDLRIITLSELFPTIKKVVTVEKAGGIYTPNPWGIFALLPMHFYLISALSGLLIGLYSSTPNTITSIPTPISLMSVLSKALFGLCARFSVEDPFTPRSFSES